MAAIFGSPVSAVLLAVELLLFEFRPRSFIPVALASDRRRRHALRLRRRRIRSSTCPMLTQPSRSALAIYLLIGALVGFASVWVTRAVYGVEDRLRAPADPLDVVARHRRDRGRRHRLFRARTLGVGYDNITISSGARMAHRIAVRLCMLKFISWAIALGSGTSGGTLAPLFTIGGGLGARLGSACVALFPAAGVDLRIAALVGMAAMFAGASRALLASRRLRLRDHPPAARPASAARRLHHRLSSSPAC